jgi:hypothetical protein
MYNGPRPTRRLEKMTPTGDPHSSVAADQLDDRHKLNSELRAIDDRLRAMVDAYQEKPSAIDGDVLHATSRDVGIEATITETYRMMKVRVYANDSFLQVDKDLRDAFKEQEHEFVGFYKAAIKALETYAEVLETYRLVRREAETRRGDLERIRQDKHAQVEERDVCIEAISDFHGKFSAMLTVLLSF